MRYILFLFSFLLLLFLTENDFFKEKQEGKLNQDFVCFWDRSIPVT